MNRKNKQGLRLLFYDRVVLVTAHLANLIDNLGDVLIIRAFLQKIENSLDNITWHQ